MCHVSSIVLAVSAVNAVIGSPGCDIGSLHRTSIAESTSCWVVPQCGEMPKDRCGHHRDGEWTNDPHAIDVGKFWASGYSQVGQDGVLWALAKALGEGDKTYVEFGVQAGCERNTRWLAERCGWTGLLLDGSWVNSSINLSKALISADNIVDLFKQHRVPKSLDLLSIDIDGPDWYVWRALLEAHYRPRIVVIEYSGSMFYPGDWVPARTYGASLSAGRIVDCGGRQVLVTSASAEALDILARRFGYTLVFLFPPDMYFVRDDVLSANHQRIAYVGNGVRWMHDRYFPNHSLPLACESILVANGMVRASSLLGLAPSSAAAATPPAAPPAVATGAPSGVAAPPVSATDAPTAAAMPPVPATVIYLQWGVMSAFQLCVVALGACAIGLGLGRASINWSTKQSKFAKAGAVESGIIGTTQV